MAVSFLTKLDTISMMNKIQKFIGKLDAFQQRHHATAFGYAVIRKYGKDSAGQHAALLTYYGFLALFPLLMVLTTVTNVVIGSHSDLQNTIINGVTDYFPLLGNQLAEHVHSLEGNDPALIVGILFTIYGARGVADAFRRGMRRVWGVPNKEKDGFFPALGKSLLLIIVGGLGFVATSIIAGYAAAAGHGSIYRALSILVSLFLLFWLFLFLLRISLPSRIKIKEMRLGAATAAIGLVILQSLGTYILARELRSLDALYSYFALALGLLFWIYLQAQVLYYSAEIATVSSKKLWPRSFS